MGPWVINRPKDDGHDWGSRRLQQRMMVTAKGGNMKWYKSYTYANVVSELYTSQHRFSFVYFYRALTITIEQGKRLTDKRGSQIGM